MTPSMALAATLARRNVHYGWVVVGVTFLTLLVTAAAMGMPGALIVPDAYRILQITYAAI